MNIFKLTTDSEKIFNLTLENYVNSTHKKEPYFHTGEKTRYFAVCPGCNNPVQIYNLYVNKNLDENKNKQSLHARHYSNNVVGLAMYNQEKYNNCYLSDPHSFSSDAKHKNKEKCNELLTLIKKNPDTLYKFIRKIASINFPYPLFDAMIKNFMKSEGYYYKYINKFNLPYGFLNMQKSINLYNQYLYKYGDHLNEVRESIQNSDHYQIVNDQIKKKTLEFVELDFYLTNHRIKNKSEETIELRIVESVEGRKNIIFKKVIPINKFDFMNQIFYNQNRTNEITPGSPREKAQKIVDKYIKK